MYMFDMNWRYNRTIVAPIVPVIVLPIQIKHVHSIVSYQWAIHQNTIGMVQDRLVGRGLKGRHQHLPQLNHKNLQENICDLLLYSCDKSQKVICTIYWWYQMTMLYRECPVSFLK